jgi:hypothetical protein
MVQKRLAPVNYTRDIIGVLNVDAPDSRKLKVCTHKMLLMNIFISKLLGEFIL